VDTSSALVAYDVTDLDNITALSSLDLQDETPQRLAWSSGLLYAVTQGYPSSGNDFSYSLEVFSLENNALKLQSRTPLAGDSRLAARGNLAALTSRRVWSSSPPLTRPTRRRPRNAPGRQRAIPVFSRRPSAGDLAGQFQPAPDFRHERPGPAEAGVRSGRATCRGHHRLGRKYYPFQQSWRDRGAKISNGRGFLCVYIAGGAAAFVCLPHSYS